MLLARAIRRRLPTSVITEVADGEAACAAVAACGPAAAPTSAGTPPTGSRWGASSSTSLTGAAPPPFDIICMDKEMPGVDGYAATRRIRAAGYRGVMVGVTANAYDEDVRAFMACGLDGVVTKPVDMLTLMQFVRAAVPATGSPSIASGAASGGSGACSVGGAPAAASIDMTC